MSQKNWENCRSSQLLKSGTWQIKKERVLYIYTSPKMYLRGTPTGRPDRERTRTFADGRARMRTPLRSRLMFVATCWNTHLTLKSQFQRDATWWNTSLTLNYWHHLLLVVLLICKYLYIAHILGSQIHSQSRSYNTSWAFFSFLNMAMHCLMSSSSSISRAKALQIACPRWNIVFLRWVSYCWLSPGTLVWWSITIWGRDLWMRNLSSSAKRILPSRVSKKYGNRDMIYTLKMNVVEVQNASFVWEKIVCLKKGNMFIYLSFTAALLNFTGKRKNC